jgi:hypothetical protein
MEKTFLPVMPVTILSFFMIKEELRKSRQPLRRTFGCQNLLLQDVIMDLA